jgi:hypothetical protein
MADERPLSALLSQVLVAFTVEFDNEFERRMSEAGYPGARLSRVVWVDLMRFLADGPITVRELAPGPRTKLQLGCLERWGFVTLDERGRDGWGSGRGIRSDWHARLTSKGLEAVRTWQPLTDFIERRWEERFGKEEIGDLRVELRNFGGGLDLTLPALLSQVLFGYREEFDRESDVPLPLCANTIRVLSEKPTPVSAIARLTGGSPETTDIGWQLKPYVTVERAEGAARGKTARLSSRGLRAQAEYHRLTRIIDARWKADDLRAALLELFNPLLSEGLTPPPGTTRAGEQTPALGRLVAAAAAVKRMRDLVAQTHAFVADPAGALPHYPLWDINRGFGV